MPGAWTLGEDPRSQWLSFASDLRLGVLRRRLASSKDGLLGIHLVGNSLGFLCLCQVEEPNLFTADLGKLPPQLLELLLSLGDVGLQGRCLLGLLGRQGPGLESALSEAESSRGS